MKETTRHECDVVLIGYEEQENLGLRSIAAFLDKHNVRVEIHPYHQSLKGAILGRIRAGRPRLVGFSLIFQRMLFEFANLIAYLRQNGVTAHFTIGGHFPTLEPEECLKSIPGLDSVVRHEGEQTLLELLQRLDQPDSWADIQGLAYREDGRTKVTPTRPLIHNLDCLPYPIRGDETPTHRGVGMCSILASRGCYYDCSFCSVQQFYGGAPGPKRRTRSPSNVAEEMEQLFFDRGVRIFIFKDDDLCTKGRRERRWIEDFARELQRRKIGGRILWRISCRVDEVDAELLRQLGDAGLMFVYLGIESGNNRGLRTLNKRFQVRDIHRALRTLQELNMRFAYGFMLFDPDSTMDSLKKNIRFLEGLGTDGQVVAHFSKMVPYAGTSIARRLREEGRLKGTIASPDYSYKDRRLNLLQFFCSQTFNFRNFDTNGLVCLLQNAEFDAVVLGRFFPDECDTHYYAEAVRDLTRRSNDSALETLSLAVDFMEERSREEIIRNWDFLQFLAHEEMDAEMRITASLNQLVFSYRSVGAGAVGGIA